MLRCWHQLHVASLYLDLNCFIKVVCQPANVMQRLPATVPQLVEASPSATEDGALLVGSHSSSVYVVNGKTGTLLRILPPFGQQMLDQHHSGALPTPTSAKCASTSTRSFSDHSNVHPP